MQYSKALETNTKTITQGVVFAVATIVLLMGMIAFTPRPAEAQTFDSIFSTFESEVFGEAPFGYGGGGKPPIVDPPKVFENIFERVRSIFSRFFGV